MKNEWIYKICSLTMTLGELMGEAYIVVFDKIKHLFSIDSEMEKQIKTFLIHNLILANKSALFKDYNAEKLSMVIDEPVKLCVILILQGYSIAFVKNLRENNLGAGTLTLKFAQENNQRVLYAHKSYIANGNLIKIENLLREACREGEEIAEAAVILSYFQPTIINSLLQQIESSCSPYKVIAKQILFKKAGNIID